MSHHRKNLLSGASTAVLVSLLGASAAFADATAILPTRDGNNAAVTGAQTMLGAQTNTGTASAPVNGATVTNGTVAGPNAAGPNSGVTTTANMIGSSATDNSQVQAIALSLATTTKTSSTSPNGIALLGVQNNTGRAVSSVTASSIATTLSGSGGAVSESGNTISATTALNQGANSSVGTVPQNFAPVTTPSNGTVAFNSGTGNTAATPASPAGAALYATGGVVVSSAQTNGSSTTNGANTASSARLGINADGTGAPDSVTLAVNSPTGTFGGSPDLSDNSLTASFSGNAVTNTIGAQAGGATQVGVPLIVANTQLNNDATPGTGGQGAFNTGSTVSVNVGGTANTALVGALTATGNTISSSATGNDAYAAGGTTGGVAMPTGGNVITLANAIGVVATSQQQNPAQQANTITGTAGTAPTANVVADLTVFNAQQNNTGANQALAATTTGATISSTARSVNGSAATTGNGITADVRGNRAYNAVQAGGANPTSLADPTTAPSAATIAATIVVSSLQSNSGLTLAATNTGGTIQSTVAGTDGDTLAGNVTLGSNTIGSSAYGNTVSNLVGGTTAAGAAAPLEATSLTNNIASGILTSDRTTTGTATAAAGFSIDNVQANLVGTGGAVTATTNGTIALAVGNGGSAVGAAALSADANNLLATAVGNSGNSAMALGGTSGTGSAGVLNQQTSTAPVAAQLTGTGITSTVTASSFAGTVISASSELERALGYGNNAANTLTEAMVNLTSAPSNAANSTAQAAGSGTATANGTLTLLSDQLSAANVTANAVPGVTLQANTGNLTGGATVTASGDAQIAAARGNAVTNTLGLSGTGVTATGTAAASPTVASLLNLQAVNGSAITATAGSADGTPAVPFVSVTTQGLTTGSTVQASNNAQTAIATGSDAANGLTVAERSRITATSPNAFGSVTPGTTSAAFALSNNQASTGAGTRQATVSGTGVAVAFGNAATGVNGAVVNADANSFSALATDNTAANALNLNGGTSTNGAAGTTVAAAAVQATGALKNRQDSTAGVTATVGAAGTPVAVTLTPTGAVINTPLGVNATVFDASATGNAATSTLALVAGTETGAANGAQLMPAARGAGNAATTTSVATTTTAPPQQLQTQTGTVTTTTPTTQTTNAAPQSTGNNGSTGDLALANYQTVGGALSASSFGAVTINNPASLTTSLVSVTNTAAEALAKGNLAVDAVNATVNATGTTAPAYALYSNQAGTSPTVTANSVLAIAVPDTTNTAITGNGNTAVASLNDATNTLTANATSSFGSAYGSQNGAATSTATTTTTTGPASAPFTPIGNQVITVNGTPYANQTATNTTTTTASPGGTSVAELALYNQQTATNATAILATARTTIGQNGGQAATNLGTDGTGLLNVSNNTTMAQGQANIAVNTLSGTAGSTFAASEALLNNQTSAANVTAQSSTTGTNAANPTSLASLQLLGSNVAASTASLLDNAATAMARGNVASNAASGGATSTASGNIALASLQTNGGAITANGGMTLNYLGTAGATGTVTANGNTSRAIAGGNTATNAVTAPAGAGYAASAANGSAANGTGANGAGATQDYAGYGAAPAGSVNARAQYAALNSQVNTGAINATNTSNMVVTTTGLTGTLNAQVLGNSISSTGYANLANNSIGMTALSGGASTAALTNYQNNTGNVTASVTNSTIGLRGATAGTGALGVNNNAISASATGNSATNIISALPTR